MQEPLEYGFDAQLALSHGNSASRSVEQILLVNIPGACKTIPAHASNDRNGTDWWIEHESGRFLSVDCKIREHDCAKYHADDLALETWSVVEKKIPGWTLNEKKRTDYVLWLWLDTGRWCLVPFPMLCKAFQAKHSEWKKKYKTAQQYTSERNYHSECVFVPRKEVWAEMYRIYSGNR